MSSTASGRARAGAVRTFFAVTYPAAVWDSRRFILIGVALTVRARHPHGRLADPRPEGARRVGVAPAAPGVRPGPVRAVLLGPAPRPVLHPGHDQQHPRVVRGLRRRRRSSASSACSRWSPTASTWARPAAWMITGGSGLRFFGLILPARPARALGHLHRGRHRPAPRVVADRARRPHPRLGAGRAGAPVDRGRHRAHHHVRLRRHDRGVRHRQQPARRRCGWPSGSSAWLAYVAYLVVFGRAAAAQGFTGDLGEVRRAADRRAGAALDQGQSRPVALTLR